MASITFQDPSGDTTIHWTEDQDDVMVERISALMKKGYTFFTLTPRAGGLAAPEKKTLKKAGDIKKNHAVGMLDDEFQKLLTEGSISTGGRPSDFSGAKIERDPKKVARGGARSIATRPRQGG